MNNRRAIYYHQLSSIEDVEREKRYLRQLIKNQEKKLEDDWNEICGFWSFIPKTARFLSMLFRRIPVSLNIISLLWDLLKIKREK